MFKPLLAMAATTFLAFMTFSLMDEKASNKTKKKEVEPDATEASATTEAVTTEAGATEALCHDEPAVTVVCTTDDAEVYTEMVALDIPCELLAPPESDASLSSVASGALPGAARHTMYLQVKRDGATPRMSATTCATYALLAWMRASRAPKRPEGSFLRVIPRHDEFARRNYPYMNTLAVLGVPTLSNEAIDSMIGHATRQGANVIVAFETRAMCFASRVAAKMNLPFVSARKLQDSFGVEVVSSGVDGGADSYRKDDQIATDAFGFLPSDRVLIVDDVVNTGSTIKTLIRLVERLDAQVVGCAALVQLNASATLDIPNFHAVCTLPPK